jgi:UDP-N-acetyl-D-mannosaminuronate dehydrogenase
VADQVAKLVLKIGIQVLSSKILVLGFTFKESCPNMRSTCKDSHIIIYNAKGILQGKIDG